jgi:hypothetical protein
MRMPDDRDRVDRVRTPRAILTRQRRMVASAWSRTGGFPSLLLWVEGGYLTGIELSWLDEFPDEFPPPETFEPPELAPI